MQEPLGFLFYIIYLHYLRPKIKINSIHEINHFPKRNHIHIYIYMKNTCFLQKSLFYDLNCNILKPNLPLKNISLLLMFCVSLSFFTSMLATHFEMPVNSCLALGMQGQISPKFSQSRGKDVIKQLNYSKKSKCFGIKVWFHGQRVGNYGLCSYENLMLWLP